LCFVVKLRITCVQLCERIDSTLEIRHGAHAAFRVVSLRESAVDVETVNHGRFFTSDSLFLSIGSDRHAYALSLIQVMHKVCPSLAIMRHC
jgi:hypothetical protein